MRKQQEEFGHHSSEEVRKIEKEANEAKGIKNHWCRAHSF